MFKIARNRFLDAFFKLILVSGLIHLPLLIVFSFFRRDLTYLNFFYVIDLHSVFPRLAQGAHSNAISALIVVLLYSGIFVFFTRER